MVQISYQTHRFPRYYSKQYTSNQLHVQMFSLRISSALSQTFPTTLYLPKIRDQKSMRPRSSTPLVGYVYWFGLLQDVSRSNHSGKLIFVESIFQIIKCYVTLAINLMRFPFDYTYQSFFHRLIF